MVEGVGLTDTPRPIWQDCGAARASWTRTLLSGSRGGELFVTLPAQASAGSALFCRSRFITVLRKANWRTCRRESARCVCDNTRRLLTEILKVRNSQVWFPETDASRTLGQQDGEPRNAAGTPDGLAYRPEKLPLLSVVGCTKRQYGAEHAIGLIGQADAEPVQFTAAYP